MISKHSPLFMPKWAARDFIQITDVRHERLQKITSYDLVAEGCPIDVNRKEEDKEVYDNELALMWYKNLWDSINPKYPWEDNPWVWRYEFKKVEK